MIKIRIKGQMYLIGKLKDEITLIQQRRILSSKQILVLIIKGIKPVIIKVLNNKTLQQKKENFPLLFTKTLHKGNP